VKVKNVVLSVAAAVVMSVLGIGKANAGELDTLVNKLADKGVISYGEAQQIMTESKEDARKDLAAGKSGAVPAWVQNLVFSGDLRLREQEDWNSANAYERDRFRVRLRMNVDTRLAENFKAGFGFATGSESIDSTTDELGNATVGKGNVIDANSGSANSTFSGFGRLPLELNLAFMEYDPSFYGFNVSATVGKMRQGVQVWNATDLLWESSLNPDGAAIKISRNIANGMSLDLIGSYLVINQLNSAVSNPSASIGDIVYTWDTDDYKIKLGVSEQNLDVYNKNCGSYFGETAGVPFIINANGGVTANSLNYYDMVESFELTYKNVIGANSVAVIGDIASNSYTPTAGTITDENASCYGVKLGAASVADCGQWQVVALSRTLAGNSWLNKLGANDPYGAAHNSKGYQGQLNMGLSKAMTIAFTYFKYDKINGATSATPQDIFQSDLIYKF